MVKLERSLFYQHRLMSDLMATEAYFSLSEGKKVARLAHYGVNTVVFDLESTLVGVEAFIVWANIIGAHKELVSLTNSAMSGSMRFDQALKERLDIAQPTMEMVSYVGDLYRQHLTDDAVTFIRACQDMDINVIIVSGGFDENMVKIKPILGIPSYSNHLCFDSKTGRYSGLWDEEILACDGGKKILARELLEQGTIEPPIAVIGDGATDMEIGADLRIGFEYWSGERNNVRKVADVCIDSLKIALSLVSGERRWENLRRNRNQYYHDMFIQGTYSILSGEGVFFGNRAYGVEIYARLAHLLNTTKDRDIKKLYNNITYKGGGYVGYKIHQGKFGFGQKGSQR